MKSKDERIMELQRQGKLLLKGHPALSKWKWKEYGVSMGTAKRATATEARECWKSGGLMGRFSVTKEAMDDDLYGGYLPRFWTEGSQIMNDPAKDIWWMPPSKGEDRKIKYFNFKNARINDDWVAESTMNEYKNEDGTTCKNQLEVAQARLRDMEKDLERLTEKVQWMKTIVHQAVHNTHARAVLEMGG